MTINGTADHAGRRGDVTHPGVGVRPFTVSIPDVEIDDLKQRPETGWNVARIAGAWAELMKRLGYSRWAAQGGDWGAVVTTALGAMQPEGLIGIHLNTQYAFPAQIPDSLSPEERHAVETLARYTGELGGSNHLQGTKPETVGFALADSPAGQAAWIYDKFQSKTDNHGLAEDAHGGHFAALEQPEILVSEIRTGLRTLRDGSA